MKTFVIDTNTMVYAPDCLLDFGGDNDIVVPLAALEGLDYLKLRDDLTESLDVCDISGACDQLRQFADALTNWYVRRSRSRFWEEDPDAIDTLHTVLEVTGRLAAPLLPLITEVIWRGVTSSSGSGSGFFS